MDKTCYFNAFYTKDYNMIQEGPQEKKVGMQGGFLMVRTNGIRLSMIYDTLVDMI